jgi:dCMP deaminase
MSQKAWDRKFLNLAIAISDWSKDPKTRVGCVMVDLQQNIVCTGFNGFPRGIADAPERLQDRDLKLQMIVHAEANAVVIGGAQRLSGCTAYITRPPCSQCAALMIQAGMRRVVWFKFDRPSKWEENCKLAESMLIEAGLYIDPR